MGFNFGAFLGGAARGGSQVLDERRAQADRDKVTTVLEVLELLSLTMTETLLGALVSATTRVILSDATVETFSAVSLNQA